MRLLIGKNILLGVTGGIAAYKGAELIRLLKGQGANVRVVVTEGAKAFVTPLTFQVLSGHRVYETLLDTESEAAMSHIELARWADAVLVAPATAHFLSKLTTGAADDLLSTLCLATTAPIAVAPAMNLQMWLNAVTQQNVHQLRNRGVLILGPGKGEQACGEVGPGRMLEPEEMLPSVVKLFEGDALKGKRVLITAGPTREAIDPVRYISNRSSGKMGYALASAASAAGAEVILVSGPTDLVIPEKVNAVNVSSAEEMHVAVMEHVSDCDIFIANAAVGDYQLKHIAEQKLKKTSKKRILELERTPDILATVAELNPRPITIGFAAETKDLEKYAKNKLKRKKLDMIVANWVGEGRGFESDKNALTVITNATVMHLPEDTKIYLAQQLIEIIAEQFINNNTITHVTFKRTGT